MESRTLLSITVNTFGDVVDAGDGLTSLREAIALAAGTPGADSITLPHQIDSVEGTYALTLGELDLSDADSLSIQSDGGPATIDAQGASRVFSIAAGSVVTLEGLLITGGSAPDPNTGSGGGIANDGTATITDCTFSGNSAGFVGGGLYNSGLATATVSDCDFEGNTSTYGAGFNNQGAATVTGGVFRNNTASGNSGGLDNIGTVSVYGTLFEANSAASYGGAVNVYGGFVGSPGTTLLQECTFRNNTSNYVAGGVQISETTGTVIDCIFEGNSAQFGGGLSNSGTTTITGGAFRNNTASGNGAGIESIGTVTIIGTLVEQNTSSGYGGGVHAYGGFAGSPGVLTITDATIRGNSAQYGGGVSFEEDQASITGTQITENSATYGGGVYNRDGDWSMDSSAVEFNTAVYVGGGLLNDGNGNATISGSSFANNTAQYGAGGGIFNAYGDSMTVTDVTVAGNVASNGGGISNFGTISVEQSALSGNTGLYGGGGIFNSSGTVVATGITLDSNSAPGNGGGGLYSSDGAVTATDSTFNANSAGSYGGGVYISGGTATIESSKLSNNTAAVSGGGIFTIGFGGLTIAANLITDNLGGGIDVQSYDTLVQSNTIINNTGDGVRIDGASNNTIGTPDAGNTITGNTGAGVSVVGYAFDNAIRGNVINSNGGPAIDLGGDGRTVNDTGDTDYGPNYLLNFPVISGFATGATTHVTGTLGSSPNPSTTFTIDFYADSATAPVNPGESLRYLGSFQVITDALGNAAFDVSLAAATAPGEIVTATATDMYGSTSEFSDLNFIKVTPTSGLYTTESHAKASFSVVLTSRPTANVTISLSSSNPAEGTLLTSSLTFKPAKWNVPQVVTVTGVDDSIADGAIAYTIVTGPATSADPIFNGMDGDDVQVTNFDNDFAPLAPIEPAGSLIYTASLEGGITAAGNVESYAIQVDPGQEISVVVEPEGTDLKAKIQLYKGNSDVLGTATAGAAGQDAVLQADATQGQLGGNGAGPKTYQIRVSGASKTTGLYHVRVILNAAVENESHDAGTNDTHGSAQTLEPSFLPLNGSVNDPPGGSDAARGAVLGTTDAGAPDYFAFSLAKGASTTVALTGLSSGDMTLALEDSTGTTLAFGRPGPTNLGQVIDNFIATKKGTYYLRVTGSNSGGTDYSLVVTRNADFEAEANDSFASAQDLVSTEADGRRWVLGAIAPTDTYVASAQSYTFEDISTTGHAILQGSDDGSWWLGPDVLNAFKFTLYGSTNDGLYVSANGYLNLPAGDGGSVSVLNQDLVIFGAADSAVYWQVLGSGNQEQLVVQWNDVEYYGNSGGDPITFEAVLSEADGSVQFNYQDLETSVSYLNEGLNSHVGIAGFPNGTSASLILPTSDAPNQFVGTGRSTRISQPPGADYYRINIDANSKLEIETQTPASKSGEFTNNLDPIVRLYDSAGNLLASDDNSASDGLDAKLSYKVPKGKGGTYYIQVDASPATTTPTRGAYLLSVKNATGALPAFQVTNTDVPDGTRDRYPPTSIQVDFNDVLLLTTLQASDLKVDGVPATGFTVVDGDTVRFDLPAGRARRHAHDHNCPRRDSERPGHTPGGLHRAASAPTRHRPA